jgi:predicted dinucleotide-binding enzyme
LWPPSKAVIDVADPIAPPSTDLVVAGARSGAGQVVRKLRQPRVVKACNTVGAEIMADPCFPDRCRSRATTPGPGGTRPAGRLDASLGVPPS